MDFTTSSWFKEYTVRQVKKSTVEYIEFSSVTLVILTAYRWIRVVNDWTNWMLYVSHVYQQSSHSKKKRMSILRYEQWVFFNVFEHDLEYGHVQIII